MTALFPGANPALPQSAVGARGDNAGGGIGLRALLNQTADEVNAIGAWIRVIPGCIAFNNAAISIPNNALTTLSWNSDTYDPLDLHTGAVISTITIPSTRTGWWHVRADGQWDGNATGIRELFLLNGGTIVHHGPTAAGNAGGQAQTLEAVVRCAAGAAMTIQAYQNSGVALNFGRGPYNALLKFSAVWLGA